MLNWILAAGAFLALLIGVEIGLRSGNASLIPWLKSHLKEIGIGFLAFLGVGWALARGRNRRAEVFDREREIRNRAHDLEEKRADLITESDRLAIERERLAIRGVAIEREQSLTREAINNMDATELETAWKLYVQSQSPRR